MSMKKYILTFMLKESTFDTFADAFKELYRRLTTEALPAMVVETIWIQEEGSHTPYFLNLAVERAYEEGLLVDGKPTWVKATVGVIMRGLK